MKHLWGLCMCSLVALLVGCGSMQQDPGPTNEPDFQQPAGSVAPASNPCCLNEGTYICAANQYEAVYPMCNVAAKTKAAATCKSHCGNVACTNFPAC